MRFRYSLLASALLLGQVVYAKTAPVDLDRIQSIVDTTTPASSDADFAAFDAQIQQSLISALQGNAAKLTRAQLEKTAQSDKLADTGWLKASGYDFDKKANQQAGIALLSAFTTLPKSELDASMQRVEQVNLSATDGQRRQAIIDAEGQNYLFFLADALGPKLGKAFLNAYNKGEIGRAAALIKASEVSTGAAKTHFNYPRPFLMPGNTIHAVPDTAVVKDNQPYQASEGSFPSGHTNTAWTDALLLGVMVPERFVPLVDRASRYGYSRMVLGVHYPIDLTGSRMVAQRNVAHYLNDAKYRALLAEAKEQLRAALEKECGTTLAECAKPSGTADPYAAPQMQQFARFAMTWDLPQQKVKKDSVTVPEGAEVLLEAALPHLNAQQRRQRMIATAIDGGYPLAGSTPEQNFWQRLDLSAAAAHKG